MRLHGVAGSGSIKVRVRRLIMVQRRLLGRRAMMHFSASVHIIYKRVMTERLAFRVRRPRARIQGLLRRTPRALLLIPYSVPLRRCGVVRV